ncbi:hypothetical protein [Pseudomonas izuensis]|uniref:hypothetical protein n=1 Tax=Pseudomonas izuensis TaxID=2684212 RepID=UPI001357AEB1|nr:hypothetical protein [Pseudomonas izuensis]
MSPSIVHNRAQVGVDALVFTIEALLAKGMLSLTMAGLLEAVLSKPYTKMKLRHHTLFRRRSYRLSSR